jgi:hypothetical protein
MTKRQELRLMHKMRMQVGLARRHFAAESASSPAPASAGLWARACLSASNGSRGDGRLWYHPGKWRC